MEALERLDIFRKAYKDLQTVSARGAVMSALTTLLIVVLVVIEVVNFAKGDIRTVIGVNPHQADTMWVYFKITFPNMHCDSLTVDLLDYKGHMRQNVEATVSRTFVEGTRMADRSLQALLKKSGLKTEDSLGSNRAVPLSTSNFDLVVRGENTFVDFYAAWCPHCQRLSPTWEALAGHLQQSGQKNVVIASVDCVKYKDLCSNQNIRGYPTMRLFQRGKAKVDYEGQRTVEGFEAFLQASKAIAPKSHTVPVPPSSGCMIQLKAETYAVPGQIHFGVATDKLQITPEAANMTHSVAWMQFGDNVPFHIARKLDTRTRNAFRTISSTAHTSTKIGKEDKLAADPVYRGLPVLRSAVLLWGDRLKGKREATKAGAPHRTAKLNLLLPPFVFSATGQSHHHYLKLVGTVVEAGSRIGRDIYSYQYTATHHKEHLEHHFPSVKITYDLSPSVVRIHNSSQRWYEFLTKLFALVGGFYTVMSFVDTGISSVLQKRAKDTMGKLS
mmetsp:Transcript_28689/g.111961  ORF Transcript_28689/g.111961 Transcript_28689/m.111961 type:complete len:499 (-) Transcript_28689:1176-2672(-)